MRVEQKILTTAEAAEILAVAERTLRDWRSRGVGPAWINLSPGGGGRPIPRYRMEDLEAFLAAQTVSHARD